MPRQVRSFRKLSPTNTSEGIRLKANFFMFLNALLFKVFAATLTQQILLTSKKVSCKVFLKHEALTFVAINFLVEPFLSASSL
jgi:hypothetical protein